MSWRAPEVDRRTFVYLGDERTQLHGWLDYYRDTLVWKCAGLTADELKRASVEPSTLTLLGLVRHMAEVERAWFRIRAAGRDLPWIYCSDDNPDGDFDDVPTADAEADLALFRAECAAADEAIAGMPLEHTFHHAAPRPGHHPALGVRARDRGVRPPLRPRRPDPRTRRRRDRRLSPKPRAGGP